MASLVRQFQIQALAKKGRTTRNNRGVCLRTSRFFCRGEDGTRVEFCGETGHREDLWEEGGGWRTLNGSSFPFERKSAVK